MTELERKIIRIYGSELYSTYGKEAELLAEAKEFLAMFEDCEVVREANPTKLGISDLLICYKGRFIACELKTETGKPSFHQLCFIERIKKCGGIAGVCRSLADIWNLLYSTAS